MRVSSRGQGITRGNALLATPLHLHLDPPDGRGGDLDAHRELPFDLQLVDLRFSQPCHITEVTFWLPS